MKKILLLVIIPFLFSNCKKLENKADEISNSVDTTAIILANDTTINGYTIGDVATDFRLQNVDNNFISLADYKDAKGFIVIFTCNHCPYAKAYEDRIIALNNKYEPLGYPVIAINPNNPEVQPEDSFELMQTRAKEKNFTFPYLFDENQQIYPQYGATKTPHVFVLKKENNENIVSYIGAIDNNYENANDVSEYYVEDAVNALLANKKVEQPTTVAIGCSIKVTK
jgi:peroxiredoxin